MNSNSVLENIFSTEVMKWRYFKSLSVAISLQCVISTVICSAMYTICFGSFWNPLTWLFCLIGGIIRPYWVFKMVIPAICFVLFTRIHVHSYQVTWWIPERRLEYMAQFLQPKRLIYSLTVVGVSSVLLHFYVHSVSPSFSSLSIPCIASDGELCINHKAILVWFLGVAFGLRFAFRYFFENQRCLRFGVASPGLGALIKSQFSWRSVADSSALFDVGPRIMIFVVAVYSVCGGFLARWICFFAAVSEAESAFAVWNIFWSLVDVKFLSTLFVCSVLLAFNLSCFLSIFQAVVTQKLELPLMDEDSALQSSTTNVPSAFTLSNAMVSSSSLLQLLSFRWLRDVASSRTPSASILRAQIFAISQPGGHPRNWQSVVNPSLNLIRNFSSRLRQSNTLGMKPSEASLPRNSNGSATDVNKNDLAKEGNPVMKASKLDMVKNRLAQLPIFCYILSELPDAKNRQIFAEAQSVIWAVEALSNLVAASFSEDQFGVVQRHISDILTALVQLQLMVEKVGRGVSYRRGTQGANNFGACPQGLPLDMQLRRSLRLVLRSSLYVITTTFKDSIREIPLEEEVSSKLVSYLVFQEG